MIQAGQKADEFRLQCLTGSNISLLGLSQSGPVLAAFFKVTCPTCQFAFPFLQRLTDGAGLQVVGISQDDQKATKTFCKTYGIRFPVLLDPAAERYPASNLYRITNVPSQFLIETDGTVSRAFKGFSRRELEEIGSRFSFKLFSQEEQVPEYRPG